MMLINIMNEKTRYTEKMIFNLFDDVENFNVELLDNNRIYLEQKNQTFPLKYIIEKPTNNVFKHFKINGVVKND